MSKTVAFPSPVPEVPPATPARPFVEPASSVQAESVQPKSQTADLRLVIEEDEVTGSFVYKVFDRRTGEVVQQFPREEVLRLREDPGYTPGHIFDAQR